ncbi:putative hydrolase [Mycolicibacterium phlei]|uniref:amidohydrolase family protein n=1 Tax=Mycolicibacterium phlei TaxID=1771 RepID=UPI000777271A|nr:amidohydrolase family protein [Mycolicibacterium phlei]AMO63943.1 Amidohydrolase [Mycolicibacterium phlei]STZ22396.1 putative hydrolase [Mycolicibacterium phlei]VEG12032.1 putative hydrolase [Mycobacteroides chelonae]
MRAPRIDVHAHFIPEFYREALLEAGHSQPDGINAIPPWDEASALALMDELNIETAVLSISSPGVHFGDSAAAATLARRVNEEGARLRQDHPGRFGQFASLPVPDIDAAVAELRYALDTLGADGVVLETNIHGVYLGDPLLEPLYAELNARRSTLFIHPTSPCGTDLSLGYPKPLLEFMFDSTRAVTNMILSGVLDRYPDMAVIMPHAGAALPVLAARVELLMPLLASPDRSAPPDIRAALRRLHFDLAGAPVPELLGALLQVTGIENIHYGSDFPFTPAPVCADLAERIDRTPLLDDDARARVLTTNSRELLQAPAADRA